FHQHRIGIKGRRHDFATLRSLPSSFALAAFLPDGAYQSTSGNNCRYLSAGNWWPKSPSNKMNRATANRMRPKSCSFGRTAAKYMISPTTSRAKSINSTNINSPFQLMPCGPSDAIDLRDRICDGLLHRRHDVGPMLV